MFEKEDKIRGWKRERKLQKPGYKYHWRSWKWKNELTVTNVEEEKEEEEGGGGREGEEDEEKRWRDGGEEGEVLGKMKKKRREWREG